MVSQRVIGLRVVLVLIKENIKLFIIEDFVYFDNLLDFCNVDFNIGLLGM